MPDEPHILIETDGHVGIVCINRPKVLNALNLTVMKDLATALEAFDDDDAIRVVLMAGTQRAWAAGADIGDMVDFDSWTDQGSGQSHEASKTDPPTYEVLDIPVEFMDVTAVEANGKLATVWADLRK